MEPGWILREMVAQSALVAGLSTKLAEKPSMEQATVMAPTELMIAAKWRQASAKLAVASER